MLTRQPPLWSPKTSSTVNVQELCAILLDIGGILGIIEELSPDEMQKRYTKMMTGA